LLSVFATLNQIFEAGIAITALSLFIWALTFNLRDRVARSFAMILACVMFTFSGEAISAAIQNPSSLEFWLRFQWIGTIFLPAAYLHFSDALLETTGRPSRGRRRLVVRLTYLLSFAFLFALPGELLLGPLVADGQPAPHLTRTMLSWIFTGYYAVVMVLSGSVLWRARQRTVLSASRRRMTYLLVGALALAVGSYPFLLIGSESAAAFPTAFLGSAALGNILVFYSVVAMAYSTAFFGVPWPDRVIKTRLFKWMLRGPVTVFVLLSIIPLVDDASAWLNVNAAVVLPILVVLAVLLVEHLITLFAPAAERWLFMGREGEDVQFLQTLQERVLTYDDLRQFLEALLAAVCDRFQTKTAFVAALEEDEVEMVLEVGAKDLLGDQQDSAELKQAASSLNGRQIFSWGDYWLAPLYGSESLELLGLLGVQRGEEDKMGDDQQAALQDFGARAALALEDRVQQREMLASLQSLSPRVDLIQRLRAASRYDQSEVLASFDDLPGSQDLAKWVKDALTHYWGGPKLTDSPLKGLRVVQQAMQEHEGNPANAMRAILREAIERNKPENESRLSAEWLLYNLLELKFLEGRKVRDVARRLAMSEADLYRKQRVAVESVTRTLLEMESRAREDNSERTSEHGSQPVLEA
jgi:hypothetical protein